MLKRVCDICKSPLPGPKRHGFVSQNGKAIICADFKRHDRIKRKRKYNLNRDIEQFVVDTEASVVL